MSPICGIVGAANDDGAQLAAVLRDRFGARHGPKLLARLVDGSERAARRWMTGACSPALTSLVLLMAREPAVDAAIRAMVERQRGLDAALAVRTGRAGPAQP